MFVRHAVERPRRTIAAVVVLAAVFGLAASRLVPDDTPSAWLPRVDAELDAYREFRARFGEDAFVLAATREVELSDPAVVGEVADLAARLRDLEGVGDVLCAARRGAPVERLRAELPARLDVLARAVERARAPGSPWADAAGDLLTLQAEANAALASALLHDVDVEAARRCYATAEEAATRLLLRVAPDTGHALLEVDSTQLADRLAAAKPEALPGLFWLAFARAARVRASPGDPARLRDLERTDAIMAHALEQDPALFHGGPDLYFAMRLATSPSLGGDPARSAAHFDRARTRSHGQDLLPWVLEAEHLAPLLAATPAGTPLAEVLAAQRRAWDLFSGNLQQVLLAPRAYDRTHPESNAVARARARELLADPGGHGVIPPPDAAPPALPPAETASLADGALERFLVSEDGRRAALLVSVRPDVQGPARAAVVQRVRDALAPSPLGPFDVAGPEVMTDELDRASQAAFQSLFPVVFALMFLVLWSSLRSLRAVLAIQAVVLVSVLGTLGLLSLCGKTLNMVLVTLPAIMAVVGTAYALHIVSRFLDHDPEAPADPGPAWVHAGRHTLFPCLLTALTTVGGFLSLATSDIPPVRDLGLFAAWGTALAFALSFTLAPALLVLGRRPLLPGSRPARTWALPRTAGYVRSLARWSLPAVLAWAALLAIGVRGATALRAESDVLRFFPPDHRLPRAVASLERDGFGLTPLELWLEGPRDVVLSPAGVRALRAFERDAAQEPFVLRAVSPVDAPGLEGRSDALAGALLAAAADAGRAGPALVLRGDALSLRATLACSTEASSDETHALVERLTARLPLAGFPPGVAVRLTGVVPLLVRVQVLLVDTQVGSLRLSGLVVGLVVLLAFRSLSITLLAVVPNVIPVLLTLGAMGLAGVPLDTATVTVAAIALGLLVDDTIHVLHGLHARPRGTPVAPHLARTLTVAGRPILGTTVTVAVGFGAFALSPFRPTHDFGVLMAFTAATALLCVLVLIPALVLLVDRVRGRSLDPDAG